MENNTLCVRFSTVCLLHDRTLRRQIPSSVLLMSSACGGMDGGGDLRPLMIRVPYPTCAIAVFRIYSSILRHLGRLIRFQSPVNVDSFDTPASLT
jgi:hypothetical protein